MTTSQGKLVSVAEFTIKPSGLFIKEGEIEARVCGAIWHLGVAARADGSGAADIIRFTDGRGIRRELTLYRRDALRGAKTFESLADQGFEVPQSSTDRARILSYLAKCRQHAKRQYLLASRMGWHEDAFVIGRKVFSADPADRVRLDGPIANAIDKFGSAGTLADYQKNVLRRCQYSYRLLTGVSLALLAPLARHMHLENGGLNIVGPAGIGKTTILRVIGSFWGGGPVDYHQSWLLTDNAPETLGLLHCDLPLLLDELDLLESDRNKAGGRLKAIVHRLSIGQGKARSHHSHASLAGLSDFHVIFASTSEHWLPDFMREGNSSMTGGQVARFVDVPADAGQGRQIFEKLPSRHGKPITPEEYLSRINRACETYYGVAGRAYLERLVHDLSTQRGALLASLKGDMDAFEKEVATDNRVDPRIRRRFGALYAAGQLGLRYGLLPPQCDQFMEAVGSCFRDAVAHLTFTSGISGGKLTEALQRFLDAHKERVFRVGGGGRLTEKRFKKSIGVRPDRKRHGNVLWRRTSAFRELFVDDHERVAKQLADEGVLSSTPSGHFTRQQRVPDLSTKEYFYVINRDQLRSPNTL
jgi:putative DNA primase/helicase